MFFQNLKKLILDMLDVHRYRCDSKLWRQERTNASDLDGVDTVEQQISIAKASKGGISLDEPYQLERFEVIRHEDM